MQLFCDSQERLFLKVNKSLFSRGNILIRKLKVRAGKLKSDLSSHLLALRFTNSVSQVSNGLKGPILVSL